MKQILIGVFLSFFSLGAMLKRAPLTDITEEFKNDSSKVWIGSISNYCSSPISLTFKDEKSKTHLVTLIPEASIESKIDPAGHNALRIHNDATKTAYQFSYDPTGEIPSLIVVENFIKSILAIDCRGLGQKQLHIVVSDENMVDNTPSFDPYTKGIRVFQD